MALLSDFGLLGKWAVNCNEEASPENPFAIYTMPPGKSYGTLVGFLGKRWRHDPYYLYSGERLSDTELLLHEEWAFDHEMRDLVISKSKDRTRVQSVKTQADGVYAVENGIIKKNGRESSWMEKCSE